MSKDDDKTLAAILGRWQPPHLGHQAALQAACDHFDRVIVGIGSSNISNYRVPFSLKETTEMLELVLGSYSNYTLAPIPDTLDDTEWCDYVSQTFGEPGTFITANPYVKSLLEDHYPIAHPSNFIPPEQKTPVSGTMVRREMARGDGWMGLVPETIAKYIQTHQLDHRFRAEFGLQILALDTLIIE